MNGRPLKINNNESFQTMLSSGNDAARKIREKDSPDRQFLYGWPLREGGCSSVTCGDPERIRNPLSRWHTLPPEAVVYG